MSGFVFRGLIAPASLKHGVMAEEVDTEESGFPGLDCPGLIEASRLTPCCSIPTLVFRGLIAPASLKLNPDRDRGRG